jgi:hypothetical protein
VSSIAIVEKVQRIVAIDWTQFNEKSGEQCSFWWIDDFRLPRFSRTNFDLAVIAGEEIQDTRHDADHDSASY